MQSLTEGVRNSGAPEIRDRLGLISGGEILDVGTQRGGFIKTLMKSLKDYKSFVGIDISEEDLEKARERLNNEAISFEEMNAEELFFDDNSFDTVCTSYTLHHFENVETVLLELKRVLKPGGYLILQDVFSDEDQSDAKITEMLIHHLVTKVDRMKGIPHFDTYKRQQLKDFVGKLGLSKVEVYESTKSMDCLFCKDMAGCEDPMDRIEYGIGGIDEILENAAGLPSFDDIQQEADRLKERVRITGHAGASLLFFVCKK